MKKEIIIAIIVGFLIGLVITFGIYQAQKSYTEEVSSLESTPKPIPIATAEIKEHELDLVVPEDFSINETGTLIATGFTTPLSYITVTSADEETFTQANVSGSFTIQIDIADTVNKLVFTSLSPDGTKATVERTVTFVSKSDEVTGDTTTLDNESTSEKEEL